MYTLSAGPTLAPRLRGRKARRAARKQRVEMAWEKRLHVGPAYRLKRVERNVDGGLSLNEYEWDGNLGKFKFKKTLKKVARVATAPVRITTAAGLQAVGVKHGVNKALGIRGKEVKLVKGLRVATQVAGAAVGAAYLAPFAGSALTAAGKGVMVGGKFLATKGAAGAKLFGGLLKRTGKAGAGAAEVVETTAEQARNAGLLPTGATADGGNVPDGPTVPNESGASFAPSGGGGGASAASDTGETSPDGTKGVTEASMAGFPGKVPPLLLVGAGLALFFGLQKHARR